MALSQDSRDARAAGRTSDQLMTSFWDFLPCDWLTQSLFYPSAHKGLSGELWGSQGASSSAQDKESEMQKLASHLNLNDDRAIKAKYPEKKTRNAYGWWARAEQTSETS